MIERPVPDAGDVGANHDIGQAGAVIERIGSDTGDAVGDRNADQPAARKRIVPDAGDVGANNGAGQGSAVRERTISDVGDAVGDRDVGQACGKERRVPDAGDWQVIDFAGDGQRVEKRTGVTEVRDGDRAVIGRVIPDVVIVRVSELGLHCGGQHRRTQQTDNLQNL